MTTSNQEMLAHLKIIKPLRWNFKVEFIGIARLDSITTSLFENNWLSWQIVSVSDDKTQITLLILGRGAWSRPLQIPSSYCSSKPSMVHWLTNSIFPCLLFVCLSRYGNIRSNIHFFQYIHAPIGTKLFWPSTKIDRPSTTKYQPVPPFTDPILLCINQSRFILTQ